MSNQIPKQQIVKNINPEVIGRIRVNHSNDLNYQNSSLNSKSRGKSANPALMKLQKDSSMPNNIINIINTPNSMNENSNKIVSMQKEEELNYTNNNNEQEEVEENINDLLQPEQSQKGDLQKIITQVPQTVKNSQSLSINIVKKKESIQHKNTGNCGHKNTINTTNNNNSNSNKPQKSHSYSPNRLLNTKVNICGLLPPKTTNKKTLVLDLDETLVHSRFFPFQQPSDVIIKIELENEIHDIHVLIRPGVKEFLEKMAKLYEIVIFTAGLSKYADPLLDIIDKQGYCPFRLFREHCTLINTTFVKDLKRLGRDLKDIIIVDNSPISYALNIDNGLPILSWFEDRNDKELYNITPILEFLSYVPDVREYIRKIVVDNEIDYGKAMNCISKYNNMINKQQYLDKKNNADNKDQKTQQINIKIINNNITNYICPIGNNNEDNNNENNNNINNEVNNNNELNDINNEDINNNLLDNDNNNNDNDEINEKIYDIENNEENEEESEEDVEGENRNDENINNLNNCVTNSKNKDNSDKKLKNSNSKHKISSNNSKNFLNNVNNRTQDSNNRTDNNVNNENDINIKNKINNTINQTVNSKNTISFIPSSHSTRQGIRKNNSNKINPNINLNINTNMNTNINSQIHNNRISQNNSKSNIINMINSKSKSKNKINKNVNANNLNNLNNLNMNQILHNSKINKIPRGPKNINMIKNFSTSNSNSLGVTVRNGMPNTEQTSQNLNGLSISSSINNNTSLRFFAHKKTNSLHAMTSSHCNTNNNNQHYSHKNNFLKTGYVNYATKGNGSNINNNTNNTNNNNNYNSNCNMDNNNNNLNQINFTSIDFMKSTKKKNPVKYMTNVLTTNSSTTNNNQKKSNSSVNTNNNNNFSTASNSVNRKVNLNNDNNMNNKQKSFLKATNSQEMFNFNRKNSKSKMINSLGGNNTTTNSNHMKSLSYNFDMNNNINTVDGNYINNNYNNYTGIQGNIKNAKRNNTSVGTMRPKSSKKMISYATTNTNNTNSNNINDKNKKQIRDFRVELNDIFQRKAVSKSSRANDLKGGFKYQSPLGIFNSGNYTIKYVNKIINKK